MVSSFLPMIMMLLGSSGGINELLDLTDPQSYLQAQGIEYNVAAMLEVLEAPPSKKLAEIKAQEVNKLQAIRALGLMKDAAALPMLEKVAAQKTQFFSEYANEAIAAIGGKPYTAPVATAEQLNADLALLPDGVGLVVQARLDTPGTVDLKGILTEALKAMPDAPQPEEVLKQMNAEIGKVASKVGNIRLDAVTVGLAANVGNDTGFVVIIGRGKYDHRAMESWLSEQKRTEHHQIDGTMFLGMDGDDVALAPVSSELMIMVSGPGWEQFPLGQVAARLKVRPAEPVFSKELQKVVDRADRRAAVWGAAVITAGMKELPPLAPFDEVVMGSRVLGTKNQTQLKLEGVGQDGQAISAMMAEMKQSVAQGIAELEQRGAGQPGLDSLLKIMRSLKFTSMGLNASVSATFDGNPANIISLIGPIFGVRGGAAPPPASAPIPAPGAP